MSLKTQRLQIAGPAGELECVIDAALDGAPRGVAVLCHPHPQHGGTLDNKVVQTLARCFVQLGFTSVRFNFRGVGRSAGVWDEGHGEVEDALAVIEAHRVACMPLVLGGFSFGAYVTAQAATRLASGQGAQRMILVGPAVEHFELAPVPADTLVVHGEVDEVVPLAAVLDWARPQSLPVLVVPGTGHFFHGQLTLLKQIVLGAWCARGPNES